MRKIIAALALSALALSAGGSVAADASAAPKRKNVIDQRASTERNLRRPFGIMRAEDR